MIILLKAHISEKSMKLAGRGEYTFEVAKGANKEQVKKAVEEKFKVNVLKVAIINIKGEVRTQKRVRKFYRTASFKKAIVKIAKDQKIAIFETPKEEAVVTTAEEGEPIVVKEKKDILRRTKVRVERGATGAAPTTQRKVITGK